MLRENAFVARTDVGGGEEVKDFVRARAADGPTDRAREALRAQPQDGVSARGVAGARGGGRLCSNCGSALPVDVRFGPSCGEAQSFATRTEAATADADDRETRRRLTRVTVAVCQRMRPLCQRRRTLRRHRLDSDSPPAVRAGTGTSSVLLRRRANLRFQVAR